MVVRIVNELFSSNTYLLCNEFDNECIIIDPGMDEVLIDQKITELKLDPIAIISTHGHVDHVGSVSFFYEKYAIPFYLHKEDVKLYRSANFFLKLSKINKFIKIIDPEILLVEKNQKLNINKFCLEIFNFPGHTMGSCIIKYENNIFTGDTLFKTGLYLNKLPGENAELLKESIIEIMNSFDLKSICYPGHGENSALNDIKLTNQDLIRFINN